MRRHLFATFLICVALLTQLGAPFAGGLATTGGVFADAIRCEIHSIVAGPTADSSAGRLNGGDTAPPAHDHASCALCQLGVGDAPVETAAAPVRMVRIFGRITIAESAAPVIGFSLNRNAPARAPPARV
ncbi:DUF2946 family protein [Methylocystis sp. ATCC 49242]|uniref:DUF2946 family protein n=1 Tax=Methylocystis sp. ATCC 49242 TaxID=622637 RepID=UPI0001F869EC|nr:DUF2946 family protein [Methylocystis sp. ATCC 49242]